MSEEVILTELNLSLKRKVINAFRAYKKHSINTVH